MYQVPDEVVKCYLEPHRHYHTLEHIYNGLRLLPLFVNTLNKEEYPSLLYAWWLHDSVYVIGASDNEERSANYAKSLGFSELVQNLVRSTVYPHADDVSGLYYAIINDIDLAGLGAPPAVYAHHTEQIRQEYLSAGIVSAEQFEIGRRQFLMNLIKTQVPLFKTSIGQNLWGKQAMQNILAEIE